MLKIILSVIGLAVAIYFHYDISKLGISLHLSFTISKIVPYALEFLAICMIIYHTYTQYLKSLSYALSRIIILVILVATCAISFYFHPIYQGDFGHSYREITLKGEGANTFKQGLTMVVLPGCPHCHARFQEMVRISSVYPKIPMHVLVINNDTTEVQEYRKLSEGENIKVGFFPDNHLLKSVVFQGFPNLYYKALDSATMLINWTNDGFGSEAWDFVIEQEER